MDDAWNELSFDFEPAVQAALPASGVGNTRDRFRTQVCRHWLRGLCMMGDRCDFLHKMDRNRMPICRWRTDCQVEGCAFRHEEEQEAPECAMYQQGFCRLGPHCRFRHVKRAREECPEVADFSLSNPTTFPTNNGGGGGPGNTRAASMGFSKRFGGAVFSSLAKKGTGIGAGNPVREYAAEEVRKPSMCNHWRNGTDCPYGDRCMYAHGEDDPRMFSSRPPQPVQRFGGKDPFTNPEVEAAVPVKEGSPARFFVLRSLNHDNLAVSTTQGKWYARRHSIMPFNIAFEKPGKVVFFFSVNYSNNFQGCAQMTARIPEMEIRTQEVTVMEFSVKWLRMCELPFSAANQIKNTLNEDLPVGRSRDGMELNYDSGRKLCKLLWAQPEIELPKSVVENAKTSPFSGVEIYRVPPSQPPMSPMAHPKAARGMGERGAGVGGGGHGGIVPGRNSLQLGPSPPQLQPPIGLGGPPPGFLFEIESQHFDECVGKLLFGLPRHLPPGAEEVIQPGNLMFLWDPGNGLVLGIFRAVSGLTELIDRTAWAPPGMETHLPWQVRVSVDLRAPPIKAADPILREVFRTGMAEPGALHPRQVDILASTMASRMQPPPPGAIGPGPGVNGPGMAVGLGPGPGMGMRGVGRNDMPRPIQQF